MVDIGCGQSGQTGADDHEVVVFTRVDDARRQLAELAVPHPVPQARRDHVLAPQASKLWRIGTRRGGLGDFVHGGAAAERGTCDPQRCPLEEVAAGDRPVHAEENVLLQSLSRITSHDASSLL